MLPPEVEAAFPGLVGTGADKTSDATPDYNCIAWAAEDDSNWWQAEDPFNQYYWPPGVPRGPGVDALLIAFEQLGYSPCDHEDVEEGFEKVAIYIGPNGQPSHMARQLPDGRWTSKLGENVDISHDGVWDLEGPVYGTRLRVLRRPT
jgi:hypothetical protein